MPRFLQDAAAIKEAAQPQFFRGVHFLFEWEKLKWK
jgi:hypothetical protein